MDNRELTKITKSYSARVTFGILLITVGIAALFSAWLPVNGYHISLSTAHALCSSAAGQLAQALDVTADRDCGEANAGWFAAWAAVIAGAAILGWPLVSRGRAR